MELNWTTLLLEAINFFILIWILKRLFYQPVKKIIDERKKTIEKSLQNAKDIQQDALTLQEKYENRLKDWEHEKELQRNKFLEELNREKQTIYEKFEKQMSDEREKAASMEKQNLEEISRMAEKEAMNLSMQFVSLFLKKLSSSELEKTIIEITIEEMSLPESVKALQNMNGVSPDGLKVIIQSAFTIDDNQKSRLLTIIQKTTKREITAEFSVESELLAGLKISIGSYLVEANLRDELKYFAEKNI